ncbi:TPA: hypothetical protein ACTZ3A_001166 [Bacillus cereus]|uniref:hypothetical protein n=1 Tax=Bacillus cereus group sp. BfR-BA-01363 TaxID=3094882 RepID=UPI0029C1A8EE|nr:hypothetical protein [Bacillus cereus group sp. BfR-BA-01363]MDX5853445.1 hypothetical protein [Bacillus cereus group sp. BfR-BA-01363]
MNMFNIISNLINQALDTLLVIAGFLLFCMIVIGPLFYLLPLYKKYIKNRELDTVKRTLIVKEYVAKRFGVEQESIIVESLEKKSTSKLIGFYEYMTKKEEAFRIFCEHGEFIFKMNIYDGEALLIDAEMMSDTNFKDELQGLSN